MALAPAAEGLSSPGHSDSLPKVLMGLSEAPEPMGGLTKAQRESQAGQFGIHHFSLMLLSHCVPACCLTQSGVTTVSPTTPSKRKDRERRGRRVSVVATRSWVGQAGSKLTA